MVTGMGAVWKQDHWMLTVSYHIVNNNRGYMMCLATMGPILGANFCCMRFVQFPFLWKPRLCAGPTELKTGHFDVVGYYYLFNSVAVRIQCNKRGYSKQAFKKVSKKGTLKTRTL